MEGSQEINNLSHGDSQRKRRGVHHHLNKLRKRSTSQKKSSRDDQISDRFIVNSDSRSDIIQMILRETPASSSSSLGTEESDLGLNVNNNNSRVNFDNGQNTGEDNDNDSSFSIENPSSSKNNNNHNNRDSLNDNQSDISNSRNKLASQSGTKNTLNTEQNDDGGVRHQNHHQTPTTKATGNMSVRCHCNLASCVTNNYMCKSERRVTEDGKELQAGCFVQELDGQESIPSASSSSGSSSSSQSPHVASVPVWNGRVATARRGCIEMLSREKQEMCSDETGNPIHCCTQDMCNYPKSFYPSTVQHINNNRLTFDPSSISSGGFRGVGSTGMTNISHFDHQVWLRAAVIAVPICGLMILVALIIVARRLLKSDEDYKNPDGCRIRRKFSQHPHYQPTNSNSSVTHSGSGIIGNHRSYLSSSTIRQDDYNNSHMFKPVYVEPSESLLLPSTQENPSSCCSLCHQPRPPSNPQQPYPRSQNTNTTLNSETEELVQSSGSTPSQNCNCTVNTMLDFHSLDSGGGDGSLIFSDSESFSSSVRPSSLFLASSSSPELPALHRPPRRKKFDFLSKIGLSRSGENNNTRPSQV